MDFSLDPASAAVALVALGVSIFFSWRQFQLQKRVTALEEARRAEELRSRELAEVTAEFRIRHQSTGPEHFVFLTNRGPAAARDVSVDITPVNGKGRPGALLEPGELPLPVLDRGQQYPVRVVFALSDSRQIEAAITWVDGEGPHSKTLRSSWY